MWIAAARGNKRPSTAARAPSIGWAIPDFVCVIEHGENLTASRFITLTRKI
jgi:hypothetical protein